MRCLAAGGTVSQVGIWNEMKLDLHHPLMAQTADPQRCVRLRICYLQRGMDVHVRHRSGHGA